MTDDEAAKAAIYQLAGTAMFAGGLARLLVLDQARKGPEARDRMASGLDMLLLQWEEIAANPDHAIPGMLAHARQLLEEFMAEFQELTRAG